LFSTKQVAEIFNVTEKTVRNWIKNGTVNAIKIHGTVRITVQEVDRLKNMKKERN